MRLALILIAAVVVVGTSALIWWVLTKARRDHNAAARWEVYSEPVGPQLDGWEIGVRIDLWEGPIREPVRSWAKEPLEFDKAEFIHKAGVLAGRYNQAGKRDARSRSARL